MRFKRKICAMVCVSLLASLLAGCGIRSGSPGTGPDGNVPSGETACEYEPGEYADRLKDLLEHEETSWVNDPRVDFPGYLKGIHVKEAFASDPDRPSIPCSDYFGLFDLTGDGVPELICCVWSGGSLDNAILVAFDVMTKTMLGESEGTLCQKMVHYRNRTDGTVHTICTLNYRESASYGLTAVQEWYCDPATRTIQDETLYSKESYSELDDILHENTVWTYSVKGQEVSRVEYNTAVELFLRAHEEVPDSEIVWVRNLHGDGERNGEAEILQILEELLASVE